MVGADETARFYRTLREGSVAVGAAIHGGMGDPVRIAPQHEVGSEESRRYRDSL